MSYIVEIKSSADIARILVLLDNGYELRSTDGTQDVDLTVGKLVDIIDKQVFVATKYTLSRLPHDVDVTASQLLTVLGLDKE